MEKEEKAVKLNDADLKKSSGGDIDYSRYSFFEGDRYSKKDGSGDSVVINGNYPVGYEGMLIEVKLYLGGCPIAGVDCIDIHTLITEYDPCW